jgi:uncharacterized protein Yka (UPF0111/DUF47 family)
MISLQKLLGKDDRFYDLLESSAEEAQRSVRELNRILSAPAQIPSLEAFHQSKEADKEITEQISQALISSYVTQLDREDIEMLSAVLYKVPKTVVHAATTDFSSHIKLLEAATSQVVQMVKKLRTHPSIEQIKGMNNLLQRVESEADDLILEVLRDLYSDRHPPTKVLAMKDLYELLEKVIDRCRDAGNVVTHIVLKHS